MGDCIESTVSTQTHKERGRGGVKISRNPLCDPVHVMKDFNLFGCPKLSYMD